MHVIVAPEIVAKTEIENTFLRVKEAYILGIQYLPRVHQQPDLYLVS